MKKLTLIIENNKEGFWGQIKEYPNVFSQGGSIEELKQNSLEALNLLSKETGKQIEKVDFEIVMDLKQFFEINDFINISNLAKRAGMNTSLLRQYSRGIKFPSMAQVFKIEKAVKQIGKQLLNTQLTITTSE